MTTALAKAQKSKNAVLPCGRPAPRYHESPGLLRTGYSHDWRAVLDTHVKAQGLKQSQQRVQLAEHILSLPGHFGIQELLPVLQKKYPRMGSATVYRNVRTLCEAGILRETLTDSDNRVVYEVNDDSHHDHIVCLDCHEIFEFHDEEIERLQEKRVAALKFTSEKHRHVIYSRCDFKNKKN